MIPQYQNYVSSSFKGIERRENWDDWLVIDEPPYACFVIFDGVSSARNGKKAAYKTKNFIKVKYEQYIREKKGIRQLMYHAHLNLLDSGITEPYTTYCMLTFNRETNLYHYSWLGDSRLYLLKEYSMEQVTQDDTHSEHLISMCLGLPKLSLEDFREMEIAPIQGYFLLCTDGFYRICESMLPVFFDIIQNNSLIEKQISINSLISGKNTDDATFILIKGF